MSANTTTPNKPTPSPSNMELQADLLGIASQTRFNSKERKFDEAQTGYMIAAFQEVNNYLRDASKRMNDHIQFYLTMITALFAGIFVIINSKPDILILLPSIAVIFIFRLRMKP